MELLVLGDRARYERYMPAFVKELDLKITFLPVDASTREIAEAAPGTQIILADAIRKVDGELMDALPNLKLVHSDGVGYNGMDVDAARERGIYVCNCKGCNADAVAEVAVMLMLMVTRLAMPGYRAMMEDRQMEYKEHVMRSGVPEFADHSVGIVGLGDIAKATVRRLAPFGNQIFYYTPHRRSEKEERELGVTYLPLEEVVERCDIVSLHCAANAQTVGMVDEAFLKRMKPGSYLINVSRGQLVDNLAVRDALLSGHLAGAGFDTLWPEPTPVSHPLIQLPQEVRDRVAYLPHLGGNTGPAFQRAYTVMWENVRRLLREERPVNVVNKI